MFPPSIHPTIFPLTLFIARNVLKMALIGVIIWMEVEHCNSVLLYFHIDDIVTSSGWVLGILVV